MQAMVVTAYGGPEALQFREVPEPTPGPRQVRIRVEATSVNFIDVLTRRGDEGYRRELPFVPGREASGVVDAVGADVTEFRVGQRVMALTATGSYADMAVADVSRTFPVPEGMDMALAGGLLMVGITAYNVVRKAARVGPGDRVLVHAAAGGVGSLCVQLAKRAGASLVVGTAGGDDKTALAVSLGADRAINYNERDFAAEVNAMTEGRGVDVILDSIAGGTFERGFDCLADRGRCVVYSHAGGRPGTASTLRLTPRSWTVQGYTMRTETAEEVAASADAVLKLVQAGDIRLPIDASLPLAQAAEAHRRVESRRSMGKVILLRE